MLPKTELELELYLMLQAILEYSNEYLKMPDKTSPGAKLVRENLDSYKLSYLTSVKKL